MEPAGRQSGSAPILNRNRLAKQRLRCYAQGLNLAILATIHKGTHLCLFTIPRYYAIWTDSDQPRAEHPMNAPAPKMKLPGHEEVRIRSFDSLAISQSCNDHSMTVIPKWFPL